MIISLKIRIIKKNISSIFTVWMICLLLVTGSELFCQESGNTNTSEQQQEISNTSPVIVKKHSPNKAALYSAVLPGLGQAYNQKYWKIPIIYAGFGTLIYFIVTNNKEYKKFSDAYNYVSDGDSSYTENDYVNKYSESALKEGRDFYRSNLELSYILTGVLYILNIIDATVDAHLFEYDISDNLTMKIEPAYNRDIIFNRPSTGLKLSFKF